MNFKMTEIGKLPFEWEVDTMENALDEIIDYRGKTPEKSETGILTLSAKSVKNGYIDYSKAYYISDLTYQKFMVRGFPQKGDILLTTEAPLGLVAKLDREKVGIAQRLLTLRGRKEYLLNDYLMYYLMSNEGQHQLTSRESGTTVTGIKQKEFRKCLISIPPYFEQKGIAHILSTLDDKIEVNNEINKTLENMAHEIFKQWFVDFEFPDENGKLYKSNGGKMVDSELGKIPEGWKVKNVKELTEYHIGGGWGKEKADKDYNLPVVIIRGTDIPRVKFMNFSDCPTRFEKESRLDSRKLEASDIVIEVSGGSQDQPVGRSLFVSQLLVNNFKVPIIPASFCKLLRINSSILSPAVFYLYLDYMYKTREITKYQIQSTGIRNLNWNQFLSKKKVVIPPMSIQNSFCEKINPLNKYREHLGLTSSRLAKVRDLLLPRLMS
ncbi:MAG TPA: restriction endonuclease subunit S, partial [Clostridiales bacterium]|nr:restriction endonuclease subunit S [Clostridiales bacterium]